MKLIKAFLVIFFIVAPIAAVIWLYFTAGIQIATILGFIYVPFLALLLGRLIKNKAEHGSFFFEKEQKKTTEAIDSGYECPFCGARFSFKRISCPDCGKSLNK